MFIYMTLSEKPFIIFARPDDFLEKCVDFKSLENIDTQAVFELCGRFVSYHAVHFVAVGFKLVEGVFYLVVRGLLPLPPVVAVPAEIIILTVAAAEYEYLLSLNGVEFTPFEVEDIFSDLVDSAAVPRIFGIFFE